MKSKNRGSGSNLYLLVLYSFPYSLASTDVLGTAIGTCALPYDVGEGPGVLHVPAPAFWNVENHFDMWETGRMRLGG